MNQYIYLYTGDGQWAEEFDIDGRWCTPEHQTFDRQSEKTFWAKAVAA